MDHPPACLDAKLLWADALDRLILANCVDQFDLASLETVWAWDGEEWELLSDDGPPATVVTGFGWDPDRDVLVRYGGIPLPEQDLHHRDVGVGHDRVAPDRCRPA